MLPNMPIYNIIRQHLPPELMIQLEGDFLNFQHGGGFDNLLPSGEKIQKHKINRNHNHGKKSINQKIRKASFKL